MDRVNLKGMRFTALIGVLPQERDLPQPIEIDLGIEIAPGLHEVVDYRMLYDAAALVVAAGHIDYIEEVAERVAAAAFSVSERVARVRVSVRKPRVPLPGPLDYAEVVIERNAAS